MFDSTATDNVSSIITGIINAGGTPECHVASDSWATSASLPGTSPTQYWCVDSSGISRSKNSSGTLYASAAGAGATATMTASGTACN